MIHHSTRPLTDAERKSLAPPRGNPQRDGFGSRLLGVLGSGCLFILLAFVLLMFTLFFGALFEGTCKLLGFQQSYNASTVLGCLVSILIFGTWGIRRLRANRVRENEMAQAQADFRRLRTEELQTGLVSQVRLAPVEAWEFSEIHEDFSPPYLLIDETGDCVWLPTDDMVDECTPHTEMTIEYLSETREILGLRGLGAKLPIQKPCREFSWFVEESLPTKLLVVEMSPSGVLDLWSYLQILPSVFSETDRD